MPDTLDALLADLSPVARLIAADWLEERGQGLWALLLRLPPCAVWDDVVPGPWLVVASQRWPSPFVEVFSRTGEGRPWRSHRQYWVRGSWSPTMPPPPPGLEDAICRALRQRLEEIGRA